MLRTIIVGFLEALNALTPFCPQQVRATEAADDSRLSDSSLMMFPLVGLLFGLSAMTSAYCLHSSVPFFLAWFLPALWLLLSGAKGFRDLAELQTNYAFRHPKRTPKKLQPHRCCLCRCLWSCSPANASRLLKLPALTPIAGADRAFRTSYRRYTAALVAMGSTENSEQQNEESPGIPWLAILLASFFVLAIGSIALILALMMIFSSFLAAMLLHQIISRWLGHLPKETIVR